MKLELWEILVPTSMPGKDRLRRSHHEAWDRKVSKISSGLTLLPKVFGKWIDSKEQSIPVRIACTAAQMMQIGRITIDHYQQDAVLYWRVSDYAVILTKDEQQ